MSRERKYRAYTGHKLGMYYFSLEDISKGISVQNGFTLLNTDFDFIFKKGKISEYTGLKDKNGKEIYEGDIVVFSRRTEKEASGYGKIEYAKEHCQFLIVTEKDDVELSCEQYEFEDEVIGNIYKNPELLEK